MAVELAKDGTLKSFGEKREKGYWSVVVDIGGIECRFFQKGCNSPKLLNVPSLASSPAISLRMTFLIQISQVSRLVIQLRLLFSVSRRRSALLKLTLSPLLSSF